MTDDERLRRRYQAALARQPAGLDPRPEPEELAELATGRLPEDRALALLDRVMADPTLRAEYEVLRATHAAAGTRPARPPAPRWMLLAAGLTLAAAGTLTWRVLSREPIAVVRGTSPITLAVPADGDRLAGPIRLAWRTHPNALRYQLTVVAEDGGAVVAALVTADTATTLAADAVVAGASYRWWVEATTAIGETGRSAARRFTVAPPGAEAPR
jgi:hypothetical protein